MNRSAEFSLLVLFFGITLIGCEPPKPAASGANAPPPPAGTAPSSNGAPRPAMAVAVDDGGDNRYGQPPLPVEAKVGVFAGDLNDLAARPSTPPPASPPSSLPPNDANTERVKAQAGVGAKGRSLDQYEGIVVTPVKSFFAAKERIAFEQAFYGQYRLYRATEDPPKDFADLKAKVLDPYQIKLPSLPPGHKYIWDAGTEELQVERPKRQ